MKELLQALRLGHVEAGLPDLYEQARLHGLTGRRHSCVGS